MLANSYSTSRLRFNFKCRHRRYANHILFAFPKNEYRSRPCPALVVEYYEHHQPTHNLYPTMNDRVSHAESSIGARLYSSNQ